MKRACYRVTIAPKGAVFQIVEGETILDAALRHGIDFPHDCGSGLCGSCKVVVDKGAWSYIDGYVPDVLSSVDIDREVAVACRATARSDLRLSMISGGGNAAGKRRLVAVVVTMERLAPDVMRLVLQPARDEGFSYRPGQYVEFLLEDGARRAYSLASLPKASGRLEFHIRQVPGGRFSERLFSTMRPGDEITLEGPAGSFGLHEPSGRPLIFVAGGTGFAPLRPMIEQVLLDDPRRRAWFYWGVREPGSLYMSDLVQDWAWVYEQFHYVPVVDTPGESDWQGRTGLVHVAVLQDHPDLSNFDIYMAGPPAMIEAAQRTFPAFGARERLYVDPFASPAETSGGGKQEGIMASLSRRLFGR